MGGQAACDPCPSGFACPTKDGTGNVKCLPVSVLTDLKIKAINHVVLSRFQCA